jgi:hypothetical protein
VRALTPPLSAAEVVAGSVDTALAALDAPAEAASSALAAAPGSRLRAPPTPLAALLAVVDAAFVRVLRVGRFWPVASARRKRA